MATTTYGSTSTICVGQLGLEMYDSNKMEFVWRGVARKAARRIRAGSRAGTEALLRQELKAEDNLGAPPPDSREPDPPAKPDPPPKP